MQNKNSAKTFDNAQKNRYNAFGNELTHRRLLIDFDFSISINLEILTKSTISKYFK